MKTLFSCLSLVSSLLVAIGTLFFSPTPALAQEHFARQINWMTDFENAKKLAKQESKPLFVLFTGSDWCPWCMRLDKEILLTTTFQDQLANKLVFVKADFPQYNFIAETTKQQNEQLKKLYNVRGFPTVILLDPSGNIIGKIGYKAGGPQNYANEIQALLDAYAKKVSKS